MGHNSQNTENKLAKALYQNKQSIKSYNTMKRLISLKINVEKIEKDRLYEGKKGTYLDAVCFYDDEDDQYGNNGMIVQQVSKEERENGVKGNILGNAKNIGESNTPSNAPNDSLDSSQDLDNMDDSDSLPF